MQCLRVDSLTYVIIFRKIKDHQSDVEESDNLDDDLERSTSVEDKETGKYKTLGCSHHFS